MVWNKLSRSTAFFLISSVYNLYTGMYFSGNRAATSVWYLTISPAFNKDWEANFYSGLQQKLFHKVWVCNNKILGNNAYVHKIQNSPRLQTQSICFMETSNLEYVCTCMHHTWKNNIYSVRVQFWSFFSVLEEINISAERGWKVKSVKHVCKLYCFDLNWCCNWKKKKI